MAIAALILALVFSWAQVPTRYGANVYVQATEPAVAYVTIGTLWYDTTAGVMKVAAAVGGSTTWMTLGSGGGGLPSGAIVLIDSGSCPAGTAEVSAMNGVHPLGTLAANGNVGTTGGADTITPAGTNGAPGFTGTAWSAPAVSWPAGVPTFSGTPFTSVINHTHAINPAWLVQGGTTAAVTGTHIMTSTATGGSTRTPTTGDAIAATSSNPVGGVASITPAGTVAWPAGVPTLASYTPAGTVAAPAFTGTQFDNRSAFRRVIYCKAS